MRLITTPRERSILAILPLFIHSLGGLSLKQEGELSNSSFSFPPVPNQLSCATEIN